MKTITTVYENGVFRPKSPVDLPAGSEFEVIVEPEAEDPVAVLKARFPNSFGTMDRKEAEEMMKAIDEEFGRINPDAWK